MLILKPYYTKILDEIVVVSKKCYYSNTPIISFNFYSSTTANNLKVIDKKLGDLQKKRKKAQAELESFRLKEREIADKIEEDAKELEKMASKQTVFQVKTVSFMKKFSQATNFVSQKPKIGLQKFKGFG